MNMMWVKLAVVALATGATVQVATERIVLKNGNEMVADVLKSEDQVVVADLGFTVVSLPMAQVVQVIAQDGDKPYGSVCRGISGRL